MAETTVDLDREGEDAILYVVHDRNTGKLAHAESLLHRNVIVRPPSVRLVEEGVVRFASTATEYGTIEMLFAAMVAFVHRWVDVEPFWERLMAAYAMLTWVYDRFSSVPYLRFLGEWANGKTRMAKVTAAMCFRILSAGGATTAAPLFRMLHQLRGTLFVDEADYKNSALWSDIIKMLNVGYSADLPLLRCDTENEPQAYRVFGPKILTTRRTFTDQALESRCLTLEVRERKVRRDIPYQLPPEFHAQAQVLRNKLCLYRLRNFRTTTYDESLLRDAGLDSRCVEIAAPLTSVWDDCDFLGELLGFLDKRSAEQRAERPQVYIVGAIHQLLGNASKKELLVKEVAIQANRLLREQEPESFQGVTNSESKLFSSKRAGALVGSLGFDKVKGGPGFHGKGYHFLATAERVNELIEKYAPPELETRATRVNCLPVKATRKA